MNPDILLTYNSSSHLNAIDLVDRQVSMSVVVLAQNIRIKTISQLLAPRLVNRQQLVPD